MPDGGTQVLLFVKEPLQDFPTPYIFKEPVLLSKGTELTVTSYYANPDDKPRPGGVKVTVVRLEKNGPPAVPGKATSGKALPRQSR
jgi:hypothetical protein